MSNDTQAAFQQWLQQQTLKSFPPDAHAAWAAPLTDIGIIEASGEDAINFLQSQLTNDIRALELDKAQLTAYCTAKGRMLASFVAFRTPQAVRLLVNHGIQSAVQKRLAMFVMRAKVKLSDAGDAHVVLGIGGEDATAMLHQSFGTLPQTDYGLVQSAAGTLIRMPSPNQPPRWIAIVDMAFVQQHGAQLAWVDTAHWWWTQIQAGIPQIVTETVEQFVPQMVNLDALGGVSFSKGCYPGQEIVARSHYLGKLKRRMAIAHADANAPMPGSDVFHGSEACGIIVNAAPNPQGGTDCLVELPIEMQQQGDIRLGSAEGAHLQFLPLPYPIPTKA